MTQPALAQAMTDAGHERWSVRTVYRLEAGTRDTDADELLDLAVILGYAVADLMVPPSGEVLDVVGGPVLSLTARSWLEGDFAWLLESDGTRRVIETQRRPVVFGPDPFGDLPPGGTLHVDREPGEATESDR